MSSNEGWGLSLTEAMITGTMIIPNVTGGMQDQCRFENEKGEWIGIMSTKSKIPKKGNVLVNNDFFSVSP